MMALGLRDGTSSPAALMPALKGFTSTFASMLSPVAPIPIPRHGLLSAVLCSLPHQSCKLSAS